MHAVVALGNAGGTVGAWRARGHYAEQVAGTGVCDLDPLFSTFEAYSVLGAIMEVVDLRPLPLLLRVHIH